jgi:hypothetical protein
MAIVVPIVSAWDPKGLDRAIKEITKAEGVFNKISRTANIASASMIDTGETLTKKVTLPIMGVVAALGMMVKGAVEADAMQHRLRQILLTTGGATNEQVDALLAHANALEKVGIASKEHIVAAQSQLATFDLQAGTIQKLTPAILDYVLAEKGAGATIEEVKSMTNGLALALDGQFAALTRVGFILDETTKKQISSGTEAERAAAIIKVLNSTYEGFNESLAQTPEGRIILLQREFSSLKTEIGQALIPTMENLIEMFKSDILPTIKSSVAVFKNLVEQFNSLSTESKKTIIGVILFVTALGPMLVIGGYAIKVIMGIAAALKFLMKRIVLIPLAIAFIITAILKAVGGFESWGEATYSVLSFIVKLFSMAAFAIARTINTLILGPINLFREAFGKTALKVKEDWKFDETLDSAKNAFQNFSNELKKDQAGIQAVAAEAIGLGNALGDGGRTTGGGGGSGVAKGADLASEAIANFKTKLDSAKQTLTDARNRFDEFAKSISGTVRSILNFGTAADAETGTFIENIVGQAEKAKAFGERIRKLIGLGLSESALREVLDAGADAGTKIADEIIAGGATVVDQVNTLLDATQSLADEIGLVGANQFYDAGIKQGEALVQGVVDAITAAGFVIDASGNITNPNAVANAVTSGGAGGGTPAASARASAAVSTAITRNLAAAFASGRSSFVPPSFVRNAPETSSTGRGEHLSIPMMANGGIVNRATLAMIGEAGPEAVIPLSKLNKMGTTININVNAGIGTDGAQVGREIVDAIRRFERASGPVFASA